MIKLNGSIGKQYVDEYKPANGVLVAPSYLYDSSNQKKAIRSNTGYHFQNSGADGDYFIIPIFCIGNESTLDLNYYKASGDGIFDLYINGVLDSSSYDCYAASAGTSILSIALIRSLVFGWNEIKLSVNGKNASSSGYVLHVYGVRLR